MPNDADIAAKLLNAVERETNGEAILWTGRTKPSLAMLGASAAYLFGIPWTAFALLWMAMASGIFDPQPTPGNNPGAAFSWWRFVFALFGAPFVCVGFVILSMPYSAWRSAARTVRVLTPSAVLKIELVARGGIATERMLLAEVERITRTEWPTGSGTLTLHFLRSNDTEHVEVLSDVPDVRRIELLIMNAQRARSSQSGAAQC
jgi:hypothetical protein